LICNINTFPDASDPKSDEADAGRQSNVEESVFDTSDRSGASSSATTENGSSTTGNTRENEPDPSEDLGNYSGNLPTDQQTIETENGPVQDDDAAKETEDSPEEDATDDGGRED
jgi:hypothetical protein